MSISLAQTEDISALAAFLYSYLPGSSAYGAYTFAHAAAEAGVGRNWLGGSKMPAIEQLLERTYVESPTRFELLIERIVRNGIKYRRRKGSPVTREEVRELNTLLRRLSVYSRQINSESFLSSLPGTVQPTVETRPEVPSRDNPTSVPPIAAELDRLKEEFLRLKSITDRQAAGRSLEGVLNKVFDLHQLEPHGPFRVRGEEIDGSFTLDGQTYLLEAKWLAERVSTAPLLTFHSKVEGKSAYTRGVFVSVGGYTADALAALRTGRSARILMMDGAHLFRVLDGAIPLDILLRRLVRSLTEGKPYVPVSELD